jgi:hypothetical protein
MKKLPFALATLLLLAGVNSAARADDTCPVGGGSCMAAPHSAAWNAWWCGSFMDKKPCEYVDTKNNITCVWNDTSKKCQPPQ